MDEVPEDVPRTPAGIAAWARLHGRSVSDVTGGRTLLELINSLRAVDGDEPPAGSSADAAHPAQPRASAAAAEPAPSPPAAAADDAPVAAETAAATLAEPAPVPPGAGDEDAVRPAMPQTFERLAGTPDSEIARRLQREELAGGNLPQFAAGAGAGSASVPSRRPKRRRRRDGAGEAAAEGAPAQGAAAVPPAGAAGKGTSAVTPSVLAPPARRLMQLKELCASREQRSSWLRLQLMAMELGVLSEEDSRDWSRVTLCRALARKLGARPEDVEVHAQLDVITEDGAEMYPAADLEEFRDDVSHHAWKDPRVLVPRSLPSSGEADEKVATVIDASSLKGMLESGRTLINPRTREPSVSVRLPQLKHLQRRLLLERIGVSTEKATQSTAAAVLSAAAGLRGAASESGTAAGGAAAAAAAATTTVPAAAAPGASSAEEHRAQNRKAVATVNNTMANIMEIAKKPSRGRESAVANDARIVILVALTMTISDRLDSASAQHFLRQLTDEMPSDREDHDSRRVHTYSRQRAMLQGELWRQARFMAKAFASKLRRRDALTVLTRLQKDTAGADFTKWAESLAAAWTDWKQERGQQLRARAARR